MKSKNSQAARMIEVAHEAYNIRIFEIAHQQFNVAVRPLLRASGLGFLAGNGDWAITVPPWSRHPMQDYGVTGRFQGVTIKGVRTSELERYIAEEQDEYGQWQQALEALGAEVPGCGLDLGCFMPCHDYGDR